jgi:UDP-4-amino-4,6-dideoxy-N-acetyl-beta-L-altrosamine N-acetyltransferase
MSTTLRPLTKDDGPQILAWRNDPAISSYMYTDHTITEDEHAGWLERMLTLDDRRGFVIELDAKPVGAAYITDIDPLHKHAVWAFYLADPSVRGRGVGSVVEAEILRIAFEELELHKLSCEVLDFNMAVVKMHRKFGFVDEGLFKAHKWKNDEWHDVYRLAFFADTWRDTKDEIQAKVAPR